MIALVIDVGNTRVKWRIARVDEADDVVGVEAFPQWVSIEQAMRLSEIGGIEAAFRVAADATPDAEFVDLVLIANVASDAAGGAVLSAASAVWPASAVRFARSSDSAGGLVNAYRDPLQLGVDRWLAAVAAHGLCPDRSILVCTFGTATTIDLVEHDRFVGGLILPGPEAMRAVLTTSTARLPASAGHVVDFGDRTEDAIASGVMAAQIGAVERTLRNARARSAPGAPSPLCIVAGGAAAEMSSLLDQLDTAPRVIHDLVLRGLVRLARDIAVPGRSPMAE